MATPARQRAQKKYNRKPAQLKRRAGRNAARARMIKAGKAHKGDGKDVAHINNDPMNKKAKLAIQSKAKNRSIPRTKTARRKKK